MEFFYSFILLVILFSFISILFGGLIKYHFEGGPKYQKIQNLALLLANIPMKINIIIRSKFFNLNKQIIITKHKNRKRFEQFIPNLREGLIILPRYNHLLGRSLVDIIDLQNFKTIHTYKHDILNMNKLVKNTMNFPNLDIIDNVKNFLYKHPLVFEDGSLVCSGIYSPLFKIDFNSNLEWINDEVVFHHTKILDFEANIWTGGQLKLFSKILSNLNINKFRNYALIKINTDGKILYKKSVIEILIENKIVNKSFIDQLKNNSDITHLNCIEPALSDSKYWKRGDLFLSLKHLSAIILYRPRTNKVINYITGPFAQQHDVDIISEKEISFFNNNNFIINNETSEVLIYNFETKKFKKIFNEQLKQENFKTSNGGVSQILSDGSLMVEEQKFGRIILFNNKGDKEWEFVNKDKNGDIGILNSCRIIENSTFVKKYKSLVEKKKNIS